MSRPSVSVAERFLSKFDQTGDDDCWLWKFAVFENGYGQFWDGTKTTGGNNREVKAHRFSYEFFIGPIPRGKKVCHKCDVPACVNPHHLYLGSQKRNMGDAARKGRMASGQQHPRYGNKDWAGERSPKAKLTEKKVVAIRKRYATGKYTYRELACRYGVGEHQIGYVVRRQSWSHVA